jgi:hypothetical protein
MKNVAGILVLLLIISSLSCKKENPGPGGTPSSSSSLIIGPTEVDGLFFAIKARYRTSLPFPSDEEAEGGTAAIFAEYVSGTIADAGIISLNDVPLKQNTTSYLYNELSANPDSMDFHLSSGANWAVTGSATVPAFACTDNAGFPEVDGFLPYQLVKAQGITINLSTLSGADSVYVVIGQAGNRRPLLVRHYGGSVSSIILTAADLATLPVMTNYDGYLNIMPVKFGMQHIGDKDYCFAKERILSMRINVQ